MKTIQYKRKLNTDGTPYLDANGDFVNEIVSEVEIEISLADKKKQLIERIDAITNDTILQGFTFAGELFSMSYNAQINWSNILQLPEAIFTIRLSTKNDATYMLTFANRMNFYLTSVNHKNNALQNGTTLKQSVINATTIAELDTIENTL